MKEIHGGYFVQCQYCEHDGSCELRHHEFMGISSRGEVNKFRFNHEDLTLLFSWAQYGKEVSRCSGRVGGTGSIFFPVMCECSASISGSCQKFVPNQKGEERQMHAERIAEEKGISLDELDLDDLPPHDPSYHSQESY